MKQHARADVPRLLSKLSPDGIRQWERNVDAENLGGQLVIAAHLRSAMRQVEPLSAGWWALKDRLTQTRAEIRVLRLRLYGKWLAILGFVVALALAFGAGVLVGWRFM